MSVVPVSKQAVLDLIIAALAAELETLTRAAKDSFAAATDPDSKAENKYDTRTLEASYVARGQAQRVAEVQEALHGFRALAANLVNFDQGIAVGSLVRVETPGGVVRYFMGPAAGGTEVVCAGEEVTVITPSSPLGQKLMGRAKGESVELRPGWKARVEAVE